MISVETALQKIETCASPLSVKLVPLGGCTGLVLSEGAVAGCDSPPFDKSMMDGFAVASSPLPNPGADGRITLTVSETITAGTVPQQMVTEGVAAKIMTGAPLPDGADCVIPIERTSQPSNESVVLDSADFIAEKHVLRRASIAKAGEELFPAGTALEAQHIAALAEFGNHEVPCLPRPQVAVLATGNELVDVSEKLRPGQIRNSNEPMLLSQVLRAGGIGQGLGVAEDNRESLHNAISEGLKHDVLLMSGGVSAGSLDLVPQVLQHLNVQQVFHKVAVKPGKPIWFGVYEADDHRCLVFGLPGNPVSSMVCFEIFVRPTLEILAGQPQNDARRRSAILTADVKAKGDRDIYFPALIQQGEDGLTAEPLPWAGSADLRTTALATGLLILNPASGPFQAGESIDCLLW